MPVIKNQARVTAGLIRLHYLNQQDFLPRNTPLPAILLLRKGLNWAGNYFMMAACRRMAISPAPAAISSLPPFPRTITRLVMVSITSLPCAMHRVCLTWPGTRKCIGMAVLPILKYNRWPRLPHPMKWQKI